MPKSSNNMLKIKLINRFLLGLALLCALLIIPAIAYSWPVNHLDTSSTGNKPYCTSCHSYKAGYVALEKVNGFIPMTTTVSTNRNASFTLDFRTKDLGYGRFSVAGAVKVPDTSKWVLSTKTGDDVPWFVAEQDTTWGAPALSPYMWVTAFSENNNPNSQKGVTLDDGSLAPFQDRNGIAHDELFTVKITVDPATPYGVYTLKLWGIGTASNGVLAYNEKLITVNVYDDTTSPTPPGFLPCDGITSSSINVNWEAATDSQTGMHGYEIYRGTDPAGPFEYVGYVDYPATNFLDNNLLSNTTYYYKINAIDNAGNGNSWASGTATATTTSEVRNDTSAPGTPGALSAVLIANPQDATKRIVKLNWNASVEGDVIGYYVYRTTSGTGSYVPITPTVVSSVYTYTLNQAENIVSNSVYYVDSQVRYGTTYYYKVVAVDVAGNASELSLQAAATPAVDVGTSNPHGGYKAKKGMCQNCHSMHSSSGKDLIFKSSITDSCYTCHDGSQSKYNTRAAFDPTYNISHHKIPEGRYSCDVCHNPHYDAVKNPRLLSTKSLEDGQIKRSGNEFCWGCHGKNSNLQNPFGRDHHTPFESSKHNSLSTSSQITGIVCRNCHVPHGSRDYPLLVSANSDNLCISCHKNLGFTKTKLYTDPTEAPMVGSVDTGAVLNNFSNDYVGTQHQKNFYGRNTCTMCHEPHGSLSNRYMLIYPYKDYWETTTINGKVYGPIDYSGGKEENMICFRCHDSKYYVGVNGDSSQVTLGSRFGSGNAKNYHDHVGKLNISCRTCHDPHSGKSAFQDTSKPAGFEWNLNNDLYINFDWSKQVGIATYSSYNNRFAFIPKLDANFNISGYSCALTCHNKDHSTGGGKYLSYTRSSNSPQVKCNGCHDYDLFDKNSRHPVLGPISSGGNMVTCEQCHYDDHTLHNKTNPYGLKNTIVTNWVYNGTPKTITTTLKQTNDPVTGQKIPAYREFCWQCHGSTPGRNILGDHQTNFEGKPHANLQRSGSANPYAVGLDAPCLTCHYHHSSSNMRLLRNTIDGEAVDAASNEGKIKVCLACHDGSPAPYDIKARYNSPSSAGHFIKADPTKKLLCTECHDSHGSTNKKYLLDTNNKYKTGITFEGGKTGSENRWFCLSCHPLSGDPSRPQQVYNTVYTTGAGEVTIAQLPSTVKDHVYNSGTARECTICHDPHKPWPATGGEDKCYTCHSRPNGEATDIKSMMGLTSQPGSGMLSKHPIADGDSVKNTCMISCHTAHPHDQRKDHLNSADGTEKTLCFSCHDKANAKAPYTIDRAKYEANPHNYEKVIKIYPADGSEFTGNCDKCHIPHGSDFKPMLRKRKDQLCLNCHNGVETNQYGTKIPDIKTMYTKAGHKYINSPTAKMYCDECHIPHGSTNDKYLRDSAEMAPKQFITAYVGENVYSVKFPDNMMGDTYKTRRLCTTCHREYVEGGVATAVYYSSETTPGGQVKLNSIPLVGKHGVQINEHRAGQTIPCTECHNPHDPEPVGKDETCFVCHGANGYATKIEPLTGLNGVWPTDYAAKVSYHPIRDVNTQGTNDCLNMCHTKHVHNTRANLIKDRRKDVNDISAPVKPNLFALASSANQVDLKVYASADTDVVGYYIYRSADNVSWTKYATMNSKVFAPATLWFYDGGLKVDQTFYYKVVSFDRRGNVSAESSVTSATTALTADTTKPEIPLNVKAAPPVKVDMQSTGMVISWSLSKDNYQLRRYNIYRAKTNPDNLASYALIGTTGDTSFTDGTLTENTTYFYRVTAVDAVGNESAMSAWVTGKTTYANAVVKSGSYYYRDGANKLTMAVTRPDDITQTPTNAFLDGNQIRVKVTVPTDYFGGPLIKKTASLTMYPDSAQGKLDLGTATQVDSGTDTSYIWNGQVPSKGSMYQLTVNMEVYHGKKFYNKEIIYVVPTTRYMKTYSDAARTAEKVVFKPSETIYVTAPSDYPTSNYSNVSVGLFSQDGSLVATGPGFNNTSYDNNTGHIKFQLTLPASGLINDNWYSVGAYAYNSGSSSKLIDIYQQILVRSVDVTGPNAPSGLSVTGTGQEGADLAWTPSSSTDTVGYNVFAKRLADSTYVSVGCTTSDTTTAGVSGLNPGTQYNFKVVAFDANGNISTDSNIASGTTAAEPADVDAPNPPQGLQLVVNSFSSITVSWNANSVMEKVTAYSVYRGLSTENYYKLGTTSSTSFVDTGLFGNTTYYYKVVAHDRVGNTSDFPIDAVNRTTKSSGENSLEGALCMSCHDGVSLPPAEYTVNHKIGTAYYSSKHNVDYDILTFKDGSIYRGNCTKCHVPHGSDYKHLLKKADGTDLCFTCHEPASASGKYSGKRDFLLSSHGKTTTVGEYSYTPRYWPGGIGPDAPMKANQPTDAGKCFNCHAPHGRYDPLTGQYIKSSALAGNVTNLNRLCFTCHSDDPKTFFGEWHGKTVYGSTYHGDATVNMKMKLTDSLGIDWGAGECANCHDPHGTQNPSMLRNPVNVDGAKKNELCMRCHNKPEILADTGLFDGSAVYLKSKHGLNAQWLEEYNVGGVVYNKTSFLPGVCLNCHNSHGKSTDNSADSSKVIKKMLVIQDGPDNEICNKCHENAAVKANQPGYAGNALFQLSAHHGPTRPGALWPGGQYYPEAAPEDVRGKCINCHDPHGTAKRDWYGNIINIPGATFDEEEELCYTCHKTGVAGMPAKYDLVQFKGKYSGHMPWMTVNVHTYGEDLSFKPRHVECLDCHNTHVAESTWGMDGDPLLSQRLAKVLKGNWGIKITSWPQPKTPDITDNGTAAGWVYNVVDTNPANYPYTMVNSEDPQFEEYMLCFKCHSSYASQSGGKRVATFMNPKNMSSHGFNPYETHPTNFTSKALSMKVNGNPVADYLFTPGSPFNPNSDINVLGEARRYKVTCSDCHGNSAAVSDPNAPKGPHGSNFDYLLKRDPKNVSFCTACHYDKAYDVIDLNYAQYSFGYGATHHTGSHGYSWMPTWNYKKADGSWTTDPSLAANAKGVDYVAKVKQLFGTNRCRLCHLAGAFYGDTDNVSVHGENASWLRKLPFYDKTDYAVRRGLNGYGMNISVSSDQSNFCYSGNDTLGINNCPGWH